MEHTQIHNICKLMTHRNQLGDLLNALNLVGEGIEIGRDGGCRDGRSAFVGAGRGVPGNFLNGTKVQSKAAAGFAFGNLFDEEGAADGGPSVHLGEHRVASRIKRGRKSQESA